MICKNYDHFVKYVLNLFLFDKYIWLYIAIYGKFKLWGNKDMINILAFGVESVLMLAILAFLVVLMVLGYAKRRKFNTQLQDLRDNVKVGSKVMTDTGVVGEIIAITTEGEHKYFTIKSGTNDKFGYIKVHSNAVYYVFDNENPVYASTEEVEEEIEETVVAKVEEEPVKSEPKKSTKQPAKKTTKKSTK